MQTITKLVKYKFDFSECNKTIPEIMTHIGKTIEKDIKCNCCIDVLVIMPNYAFTLVFNA